MKGIIVAAGYGTRFLPATKTVPKEMLPILDRPAIDFIIEEFLLSGINDILIITSRRKKAMEDYFDREIELESVFLKENNTDKLAKISPPEAKVTFIRQQAMKGTGDALMLAKGFAGSSPVIVAYPDDLHIGSPYGAPPLAQQLVSTYEKTGCSVLATIHDPPNINRYGVIALAPDNLHVTGIVEKPAVGKEPSREVAIGRYLFTPDFFEHLEADCIRHRNNGECTEFYHIGAINMLAEKGKLVFSQVKGKRLDTGDPSGYLEAIIIYAKKNPEYKKVIIQALEE